MRDSETKPEGGFGRVLAEFQETTIAVILGAMTLITVINVFFRYTFNWQIVNWLEAQLSFTWPDSLAWGYQTTLILFSWLVLFGMGYAVKLRAHLGVDAVINTTEGSARKLLAYAAVFCCLLYAFLLMKGSWDYFASFVNLPKTEGRWFPLGLAEMRTRDFQAFYTFDEIGMPPWLMWMEGVFQEEYDKLPRSVGYVMLPIGAALLLIRFAGAALRIHNGTQDRLIVSHEVEDDLAAVAAERST